MSILNVNDPQPLGGGEEEIECCPLHGDVLEIALSRVPFLDLLPASRVSHSWHRAVSSSLLHLSPAKPWLLLHPSSSRSPTLAYDPRSHLWMHLPSSAPLSPVRSSHPRILYSLTPSSLSFSQDPFNLSWHRLSPPKVWRVDPVVALVGSRVVVAGGTCDFEDDPLAVEVLDVNSAKWTSCGSMPALLKGSSSAMWLSVTADDDRMYVAERSSGRTYTYRPEAGEWSGPHDLRTAPDVFQVALGCVEGGTMAVVGLIGEAEEVRGVKLWEVQVDSWEMREIGEMENEMVEGLKDKSGCIWSIGVCGSRGTGYVYNPSGSEGVVRWETVIRCGGRGKVVKWEMARNAAGEAAVTGRIVWRCVDVGINELEKAAACGRNFMVADG
ncbi:hypothetical protein MLD38_037887 [Melastoma candidum]|uniref:Uncharacterized protein n=1 Tax=Melastoma candidum TaxID=119954 RepID=A0ACB9KXU9_9MYRT|nr:hypothetical protein MLD38_037887 [Melastoma candidum]